MIRRVLACRRGAVAVESAILFPMLIGLVLATIEFALLLFTYSSMQTAAREVTRQIAVNFTAAAEAAATAAVAERLPVWSRGDIVVSVTQSAPGDPEVNVIRLGLALEASQATPIRVFVRLGGDWTLRTAVEMKQELPFVVPS